MNEAKYPELKTELTVDPLAFGYAGMDAVRAAAALNSVGLQGQTKARELTPTWMIVAAVDEVEWETLTAAGMSRLQGLLSCVQVDMSAPKIRAILLRLFNATPATKANLTALALVPAARWEKLNFGGEVAPWDVERAKAL